MKSTHRHPINRLLHVVGLLIYVSSFYMLITYLTGQNELNLLSGLALWFTAIDLFIVGHVIEGNVGAMTLTLLFKYVRFKHSTKKSNRRIGCVN